MSKVKMAIMVSGGGTNMQSIIDEIEKGNINGEIEIVISSNPKAYALERARIHNIEAVYIGKENCKSAEEIKEKTLKVLEEKGIELIILAGYMSIIDKAIIEHYKNRIINVHPSLIPSFCGKGYYGKRVHQAAIDYGVKITGATVHFVDEGIDTGKIIAQQAVEVKEDDTADSLASRVLEIEHKLLPLAIKKVIGG